MIAVDTNVLVYAHREESPHHAKARETLEELVDSPASWGIPWPCVHEFLAVTTHPRIWAPPTPMSSAVAAISDLVRLPGVTLLAETPRHWQVLTGLVQRTGVVGPRVHDARIAALCLSHGVDELLTADRDFGWFPELRVRNPLV